MFNRKNKSRKMKKIFQWEEYLNWKNMSKEQKLNFKRACLFPFLVYMVYVFLNQYSLAILLLLGLYFLIRFKNRDKYLISNNPEINGENFGTLDKKILKEKSDPLNHNLILRIDLITLVMIQIKPS